jgi:surface polysaccharide O-acyltransferase-like enzyme
MIANFIEKDNNSENWAHLLRAVATFAVIILHVSAPILNQFAFIPRSEWLQGNIFNSSVRFCVPVFVMLTGALILPKKLVLDQYLKKRAIRILLPFIFWSVLYIIFFTFLKLYNGKIISPLDLLEYTLYSLKNGASYHLWYIYMIFGIYLVIPIINKWILNCTMNEIIYFILIWFILLLFDIPILEKFNSKIDLNYFKGYIGYLILGYFLSINFNSKTIIPYAILLIISGIIITSIGTFYFTTKRGEFYDLFYFYLSPNVVIVSIGVFLLFKNVDLKNGIVIKLSILISKFSYGIYLSHVFVLIILSKIGLSSSFINPTIGIISTSIICLLLSFLITRAINNLPFGHFISG